MPGGYGQFRVSLGSVYGQYRGWFRVSLGLQSTLTDRKWDGPDSGFDTNKCSRAASLVCMYIYTYACCTKVGTLLTVFPLLLTKTTVTVSLSVGHAYAESMSLPVNIALYNCINQQLIFLSTQCRCLALR